MGAVIGSPLPKVFQIKTDTGDMVSHTGDLLETDLKSYTIPGGLMGANGSLRIKAFGRGMGAANTKTFRLYLNANIIAQLVPVAGTKEWDLFATCHNLNDQAVQNWFYHWQMLNYHDIDMNGSPTAIDTSVDTVLKITVQLVNAADSGELWDFTVEVNREA